MLHHKNKSKPRLPSEIKGTRSKTPKTMHTHPVTPSFNQPTCHCLIIYTNFSSRSSRCAKLLSVSSIDDEKGSFSTCLRNVHSAPEKLPVSFCVYVHPIRRRFCILKMPAFAMWSESWFLCDALLHHNKIYSWFYCVSILFQVGRPVVPSQVRNQSQSSWRISKDFSNVKENREKIHPITSLPHHPLLAKCFVMTKNLENWQFPDLSAPLRRKENFEAKQTKINFSLLPMNGTFFRQSPSIK